MTQTSHPSQQSAPHHRDRPPRQRRPQPGAFRQFGWTQVNARRLARHGLAGPGQGGGDRGAGSGGGEAGEAGGAAGRTPADVVAALCGAHAQVLSAAELSIATRLPGATRTDVREALWEHRTVVKTYGPRGTVHLLAARDLPMWTGALSALPGTAGNGSLHGLLTSGEAEQLVEAIGDALADAELTVDELTEALVARAGSWAADPVMEAFQDKWPRWRVATALAAHRGALCFGPVRGRKVTYTHPHRWLPGFRPADARAALTALAKRYLYAYGPAAPRRFAQWLAAPRSWARTLFDGLAAAGELEQVTLDGEAAWQVAGDTGCPSPGEPPRGVRLLPYFDAFTVGSHPRARLFPGRAADRALAGGQAGNYPVLLVDGTVAGVWHQRRSGRTLHLTVEPLSPLTRAQHAALEGEAARAGTALEGRAVLTVGRITVGPHA